MCLTEDYRPDIEIFLLHGINTYAEWQPKVRAIFEPYREYISVETIKYGKYSLWKFLRPRSYEDKPLELVKRELTSIIQNSPNSKIVVIAHSFGTYLVTKILLNNPLIKIDKLILCGSIVDNDFPWHNLESLRLNGEKTQKILNECGRRDMWSFLAMKTNLGYGNTGIFGIGKTGIYDRFHDFKHSDYFKDTFTSDYWLPYIVHNIIKVTDERETKGYPWYIKYLIEIIVSLIAAIIIFLWYVF